MGFTKKVRAVVKVHHRRDGHNVHRQVGVLEALRTLQPEPENAPPPSMPGIPSSSADEERPMNESDILGNDQPKLTRYM